MSEPRADDAAPGDAAIEARGRARTVLWSLLVVFGGYAIFGDKPWIDGIVERIAEGKSIRPIDYWVTHAYWVVLANTLIVGALLRFQHLWMRAGPEPTCAEFAPPEQRLHPVGWALVALAMIATAILASPRLGQSLWDDEENTVRTSVAGYYDRQDDGSIEYHDADLRDTLFSYSTPNNHIVHNLIARIVTKAWPSGGSGEHPDLVALRLPSFVFGLTSLAALAALLWRFGFPWAGVFAAWVFALHPWHIKYASEARTYSLVFALIPLLWILGLNVLHRGSWRRWAAYGATQFVLLWGFPGAAYLLVATNLLVAAAIWTRNQGEQRIQQGVRWFVANLLGAMTWALLMAGNVAQFLEWLERKGFNDLGFDWLQRTASYFLFGMSWKHARKGWDEAIYPEGFDLAAGSPALFYAAVGTTLAFLLLGTVRLIRSGDYRSWLPVVLLLPGPLTWYVAYLQGQRMYPWYLISALPSLVAVLALGATWTFQRVRPAALSAALSAGLCVLYLGGAWTWTAAPREALRTRSWQPYLESVLLTRPSLDPFAPGQEEIITISISDPADFFDPRVHHTEDSAELLDWIATAEREGRPLFVNYGHLWKAARYQAELVEIIERPELFELVAYLPGFVPRDSRRVYRYRPQHPAGREQPR